jgi:rare lipoprotein A
MRQMRQLLVGCAVAGFVMLCPRYEAKTRVEGPLMSPVIPVVALHTEVGVASWYGQEFQGNTTASGESFDLKKLTAAHRELPLGTKIKVTNLRNRRSVVLRVNDRGPNIEGRLLDVSQAAAERLGFRGAGKTTVRIKVLTYPKRYLAWGMMASVLSLSCVNR